MVRKRLRVLHRASRRLGRKRSVQLGLRNLHFELLEDRAMLALVGAYSFNEGTGTSVADFSGTGNVGTTSNTTWATSGKYGGALSFNGTSSRVNVADANSLDLTTGMTLEAWVNPTAVSSAWRDVIYKGNDIYYLTATSSNSSRPAGGIIAGGVAIEAYGSAALTLNTWTHLATTYDGAALRLYVNGALISSTARTGNLTTSTNPLQIGSDSIYGQYFAGLIDEVRVYNTALTQAQIQTDMNTPVNAAPDTTPPTVTSFIPANGSTNIATNTTVTVIFSEPLTESTVSGSTVLLMDGATAVATNVLYNPDNRAVMLTPTSSLANSRSYTLVIKGGASGVKDLAGNALVADVTSSFTTLPLSLALTVSDASVVEGNAGTVNATFTVTLSAASTQSVTVTYASANGTATAGSDYVAVPPTVLTFNPGETVKTILVAVQGDLVAESNETFLINLSSPTNAVLGDAQGVGTIIDDEATFIGSEGFGYSASSYPYEVLDLVPGAAGVTTIRSTGDNNTDTVTLTSGNTFNFYGTTYTSLIVSTNGLITFASANTSAANSDLTSTPTQRSIAPLWDDWINTTGNAMLLQKYQDINGDGINDRLIFEWNNVQGAPTSPSAVTFQAILQLNTGATPGAITFNYPDLDAGNTLSNGGSATVGIKDTGTQGTRRLLVSFNSAANPYVASAKAIRIAPETTPPSVNITGPANGATVASTVTVSATASDNVGVVGVQFYLDGVALGAEDTTAPYSVSWNTLTVGSGPHTLTAHARDAVGNPGGDSSPVTVTVTNANDPAAVGQWSSVMNWPLVAINMVQMNNGKILMWDGGWDLCIGCESVRVWDPSTNTFTPVPIPDPNDVKDIFCSAQTVLSDGRVLIVGGHECNTPGWLGQANTYIFDPATYQWTILPLMEYRRWYPTATALPDGRAIVIGGSDRDHTSANYSRFPEVFNPQTNTWTTITSGNQIIPNYAFVFVLPDGTVLVAGSDESPMATYKLNVATQTWSVVDATVLNAGSAVMYAPGKVMKAGGSYIAGDQAARFGVPSVATTYVLDTSQASPKWQQSASMAYPRSHLNLTVLPDGKVAATGGSTDISGERDQYAVLPAEMWSPVTQTWTTMSNMQTPRMYHSTALLLPDGRILSAGGGRDNPYPTDYLSAEIYSPPYLFKGARPTITAAPTTLAYGSNFFVQTPNATDIASVSLIRNGSVTHGVDMDQRFIPLTFTQGTGGLNVQAPANANLAPPGYYMLFIVNSNGVPSIAPFVRLPLASTDTQPPTAPANLTATGGTGTVTLSWSAASDNTGVVNYNVYRSTTSGFTPSTANRIAQPTTTSYTDTGLTSGTYYYKVTAQDAAGNVGSPSSQASSVVSGDTTPPTVSMSSPTNGTTVSGTISVNANAADNVGIAGVQFLLDGNNLGAEDTAGPYTASWNTTSVSNGSHILTARARDTGGNTTLSAPITVTVSNVTPSGLVLALGFNENTGNTVTDSSGNGNNGTLSGTSWSTSGKYGNALSFSGSNALVSILSSASLNLTTGMTLEAWVNPSASSSAWRDVIYKSDDIYYLEGSSPQGQAPAMGGTFSTNPLYGTAALAANTWSHLAATYDGATMRLYVNGAQVASRAQTGAIRTSTGMLTIGGDSLYGQYFAGRIDEVRIYNSALSSAAIQADMNTPVGSPLQLMGERNASPVAQAQLTTADVRPLLDEAVARWQMALGNTADARRLRDVRVQVMDLPGNTLGMASSTVVYLDIDAAGYGWFLDPTPWEDSEFAQGHVSGAAKGKVDLLTVLVHELGHIAGMNDEHLNDPFNANNVMTDALPLGVRRSPLVGNPPTALNAGAVGDALWAEFDPFDWLAHGKRKRSR